METKIRNFIHTSMFTKVLYTIGIIIIALVIFQAGIFVGVRKAEFSGRFGENYRQTFGGPQGERMGMMGEFFPGENLPNTHGATGKIVKINLPTIVTIGPDNIEKVVVIQNDTLIRRFRDSIKSADLKVNDFVVVLGTPNSNSQVEAKLIRVMPEPPQNNSATSTR